MYVLTERREIAVEIEHGKEALLQGIHAGQAGGGGELSLSLTARIHDQGFSDGGEFLQHGIDAEFEIVAGQFSLQ